jgi:hypothetical protein
MTLFVEVLARASQGGGIRASGPEPRCPCRSIVGFFSGDMPAVGPQTAPKSQRNRWRAAEFLVKARLFPAEQARIVQLLVERVDVQEEALEVRMRAEGLASLVGGLRQDAKRMAA